ncbi:UNVERIFIED_ORG: aldehyde dehydrogenase family protein [Martelella mediterranea]
MTTNENTLFIGGRWSPSETGQTYTCLDPYTGGIASRAAAAGTDDVDRAVMAARQAFAPWAALAPHVRGDYLTGAANAVEARAKEIATAITAEMGGPAGWGAYNVKVLCEKLRFAAGAAYQGLTGDAVPSNNPDRTMMAIRKPAGVVVSIVPWNAPALLVGASVPAALIVGNTVVIKASEQTPLTQALVVQCFADAGLPDGVVNLITNAPDNAAEVVDAMIEHRDVRRIHFTGSTRIGRIIAEKAGAHLKRAVLELGGKAPFIVLADADLDRAVSAAAFGSFANSGQGCLSALLQKFCRCPKECG